MSTRIHTLRPKSIHHIVIVGGGAGGLELATLLGDSLGKKQQARITLIDQNRAHMWKPMLHEVAAGSLNQAHHQVDYMAQAHWHHFRFCQGSLCGLDRQRQMIYLESNNDEDTTMPQRSTLHYDTLVIAVGSSTNDFNTPGVTDYAVRMDNVQQAERFNRKLLSAFMRAHNQQQPLKPGQLHIAIVGGGATGVELAAELYYSIRSLIAYGLNQINPEKDVRLTIIESAPRLLAALPEEMSQEAELTLEKLGINVLTNARVEAVKPVGVKLNSGKFIPAEIMVWAAGVRAPAFLKHLNGLETNHVNQLVVKSTLQTTRDPQIFAFGDCAAAPWLGQERGKTVPARAQVAHQQARFLAQQLIYHLQGKTLKSFHYSDHGSLVSLGKNRAIGGLNHLQEQKTVFVKGYFARLMYDGLYKKHQLGLHGFKRVAFDSLTQLFNRQASYIRLS
ncbi:MAG: NAD(P)/FAD-dependent oxidoreductase [Thiofilum sp.]|uniref:NAD(P)/FAD-dependent oxidoreductase n=1 Tax=Thiofilum sp. TaxID=2212733 RepID=UPI0025DEE801|nr:NAD(P)/FAD-dependent oxidoreductase [Thiofilum sp.]MBK8453921.1 NAD(P)/FAD-dependent oxidoreductase [Thiofilum sp.]